MYFQNSSERAFFGISQVKSSRYQIETGMQERRVFREERGCYDRCRLFENEFPILR